MCFLINDFRTVRAQGAHVASAPSGWPCGTTGVESGRSRAASATCKYSKRNVAWPPRQVFGAASCPDPRSPWTRRDASGDSVNASRSGTSSPLARVSRMIQPARLRRLQTAWTKVFDKAKVLGRWHDKRHTLATEIVESGADDEVRPPHESRRKPGPHASHKRASIGKTGLRGP